MELVFVHRWGEGAGGKKRWRQMMFRIITLRFILLLHCFYLCPLCGLAERWAIFWRSTQPNKMIFKPTDSEWSHFKDKDSPRTCTLQPAHVRFGATCREYLMRLIFQVYIFIFYNFLVTADSDTSLIASGLNWFFYYFFFNKLVHELTVHSWLNDFC